MKKMISILLAVAACVALAACGGGNDKPAATVTASNTPSPTPSPSEELLVPTKYESGETYKSKFGFSMLLPKGFHLQADNEDNQVFRYENNPYWSIVVEKEKEADPAKAGEVANARMDTFVKAFADAGIEVTKGEAKQINANGITGVMIDAWAPRIEQQNPYCFRSLCIAVDGQKNLYRFSIYLDGDDINALEFYNELITSLKKI
jgi:hypothetical protein